MAILIRLSELCHFASQSHHSSFRWKMTPMLGLEPKPFWALHALQKPPCSLRSVFQNPSASLNKDISFCTSFLFLTIWYRNSGAKCCPNSLNHVKPTKNWFPLSAPPTPFRLGLVPSVAKAMRSHATLTLHLGNAKSHSNLQYRNLSPATGKQAKPLSARTFLVT